MIPDQDALLLNAQVMWSNSNVPQEEVINRGMGIQFVQNKETARQRLEQAIAMHQENNT